MSQKSIKIFDIGNRNLVKRQIKSTSFSPILVHSTLNNKRVLVVDQDKTGHIVFNG